MYLSDISVGVRGWLEWWDGARAPWSSGRPVSGPAPQPPPPSISPLLLPATQRAASIAMEASNNQQQKEKEPRVHRPCAFDKVLPLIIVSHSSSSEKCYLTALIIDLALISFRWRGWCGRCKTLRAGYPCAAKNNFSLRSPQRSWVSAIDIYVVE